MSALHQIEPDGEALSRFSVSAGSSCTLESPVSFTGKCTAGFPKIQKAA